MDINDTDLTNTQNYEFGIGNLSVFSLLYTRHSVTLEYHFLKSSPARLLLLTQAMPAIGTGIQRTINFNLLCVNNYFLLTRFPIVGRRY